MTAGAVLEVLGVLEDAGVDVVLDGGWGVDALLGRETREHDDLDLQVALEDAGRVETLLGGLGYVRMRGGRPANFVLRAPDDRRVDVHALALAADGGGVYELEDGSPWVWPPGSFGGTGRIDGRTVRCLTAEAQVLGHAGYELGATDLHDLELLRRAFGF